MYENLKKMPIKAKKKLKNANFFLEVCLLKLDKGKIINCVPNRIFHSCLYDSNLLVSVSKFGIDTTKNRWYRIGIVSVSYRFEKSGIAHS